MVEGPLDMPTVARRIALIVALLICVLIPAPAGAAVVDEQALYTALTTKVIAAAGLDVMVEEPPIANHPLFALENVTFTPHTAGPTWDNWFKAFRNAFDNVQRVARGETPLWVIPELRQ